MLRVSVYQGHINVGIIREPDMAIDALIDRIRVCYDQYVETTALRHYWPDRFPDYPVGVL